MDWKAEVHTIKEIYPGQFYTLLNFASNKFLEYILDDNYKYVWVSDHIVAKTNDYKEIYEWQQFDLPLFNNKNYHNILARKITFEFAMPTTEFRKVLPELPQGITLIQLNQLPQYYLQLDRIEGKTRYELLTKECDYLFEIILPNDYGELVSSNRDWLESLLNNKSINWDDLP
jgi:hypothetical protein